jgi:hypothetical protein
MRLSLSSVRMVLVVVALASSVLACGGRVSTDVRVYTSAADSIQESYDAATDRILREDVWLFRRDGTFDALLRIAGREVSLTGTYEGDDAGDQFIFRIDVDGDGDFDDQLVSDADEGGFSWIEWRPADVTYRYWLAR